MYIYTHLHFMLTDCICTARSVEKKPSAETSTMLIYMNCSEFYPFSLAPQHCLVLRVGWASQFTFSKSEKMVSATNLVRLQQVMMYVCNQTGFSFSVSHEDTTSGASKSFLK